MALRINAGYKDSVNVTFDDHFTDELSLYIRIKKDPVFKPDPYENDTRCSIQYRILKKGIPTEQMMYFKITQQLSYKAECFIFFTALLAI